MFSSKKWKKKIFLFHSIASVSNVYRNARRINELSASNEESEAAAKNKIKERQHTHAIYSDWCIGSLVERCLFRRILRNKSIMQCLIFEPHFVFISIVRLDFIFWVSQLTDYGALCVQSNAMNAPQLKRNEFLLVFSRFSQLNWNCFRFWLDDSGMDSITGDDVNWTSGLNECGVNKKMKMKKLFWMDLWQFVDWHIDLNDLTKSKLFDDGSKR